MIRALMRFPFMWPVALGYYTRRLFRLKTRPLDGNWIYFFRQAMEHNTDVSGDRRGFIAHNRNMHHKAHIRSGTSSDVLVYTMIMFQEEYRDMKLLVSSSPAMTIIDASANAGYFVLYALNSYPHAAVICIEPDASNCDQIRKQVELNDFRHVKVEQAALWTSEAKLDIVKENDGLEWNYRTLEAQDGAIRGLTLQSLLRHHHCNRIDLFKMDIEGSETVLFTDKSFVEASSIVEAWIIEIHDDAGKELIESILRGRGYAVKTKDSLIFANR